MLKLLSLCILALSAQCSAINNVWSKHGLASENDPVRLVIGVKHSPSSVQYLNDMFRSVSNPHSPQYGKYFDLETLSNIITPDSSSVEAVQQWIQNNDIPDSEVSTTLSNDFFVIRTTASRASRLLQSSIHVYHHQHNNQTTLHMDNYHIPSHVSSHIDFVSGIMHLSNQPSRMTSYSSGAAVKVTPDYIRSLYNIDLTFGNKFGSQATANFLNQFYSPDDLLTFYEKVDPKSDAGALANVVVVGENDESNPGVEAALDIQYITAIGGIAVEETEYRGETDLYQGQEPFLNWLVLLSNDTTAPLVNSVSYGDEADTVDPDYIARVEIEFQKAGVRGLTFLIASGDSGVGCLPSRKAFRPEWPTSSPYVTSVGATQTTTSSDTETVASFSGGGFSNVYPLQDWQADAVTNYLTTYSSKLPPSSFFNSSGRAYPDVASLGVNFQVVVNGYVEGVSGTSAATPLFAGVVTLLNAIRLSASKPPLGFPNPLLYEIAKSTPEAFFDVTTGQNGACGTNGFPATKGWDGSTGLGTPRVDVLAKAVLNY